MTIKNRIYHEQQKNITAVTAGLIIIGGIFAYSRASNTQKHVQKNVTGDLVFRIDDGQLYERLAKNTSVPVVVPSIESLPLKNSLQEIQVVSYLEVTGQEGWVRVESMDNDSYELVISLDFDNIQQVGFIKGYLLPQGVSIAKKLEAERTIVFSDPNGVFSDPNGEGSVGITANVEGYHKPYDLSRNGSCTYSTIDTNLLIDGKNAGFKFGFRCAERDAMVKFAGTSIENLKRSSQL